MTAPPDGSGGATAGEALPHSYEVRSSRTVFTGRVVDVRSDIVAMPGGGTSQRDVVVHPGAVGVVALSDRDEILLISQYRHPVGQRLWELPAGLLDVVDEPAIDAAHRELHEEAHLRAREWLVLVDAYTSPGMTDEAIRLYLARGVEVPPEGDRHDPQDEEAELVLCWVPLEEAVRRAFAGEIQNAMALLGILAADRARAGGYRDLRPPEAPWPARPSAGGGAGR